MSATPPPPPQINMSALIAAQVFQAMMGYSMVQPSDASPTSTSQIFNFAPPGSPFTMGFQVSTTVQITPHIPMPEPEPEPKRIDEKEFKSEKQLEKAPVRQLIEEAKPKQEKQKQKASKPRTVDDNKPERKVERGRKQLEEEVEVEESELNDEEEEELIIEELKGMAMGLKKGLLRRFKKGKSERGFRLQENLDKGAYKCTYPSCSFSSPKQLKLDRHLPTHYPEPYFCPICYSFFSRVDRFDNHFFDARGRGKGVEACVETEDAMRYEVAREKNRFNIYWLGAMEDYPMPEEHFEVLANRKRGEMP